MRFLMNIFVAKMKIIIYLIWKERLVPGFALEVKIIFKPDEYKYYNDSIKIFCEVNKYFNWKNDLLVLITRKMIVI